MKGRPIYWVVAVAIAIIFLQRGCGQGNSPADVEDERTTTVEVKYLPGDSIPYAVHHDVPVPYKVPYYKDTGSVHWRYHDIDTMAILADYFATYYYSDTASNDSTFLVIIQDSIAKNKIAYRSVYFQSLKGPTVITATTEIIKHKTKVFVGFNARGSAEMFGAGPSVGLLTKRDRLFTFDNNLLGPQPNLGVSIYWKVSFKRNKK